MELAADIRKSYHGNGQESICLMFQAAATSYYDCIHQVSSSLQLNATLFFIAIKVNKNLFPSKVEAPDEPLPCTSLPAAHTPKDLFECFLNRKYRHRNFVPHLFIPCCGQVCKTAKWHFLLKAGCPTAKCWRFLFICCLASKLCL